MKKLVLLVALSAVIPALAMDEESVLRRSWERKQRKIRVQNERETDRRSRKTEIKKARDEKNEYYFSNNDSQY